MNQLKIIILLLVCLSFSTKAQEKYTFKIDKKDADLRINVPVRNFFFISKIIDGRTNDTSRIGFVYKRFSSSFKSMEATFEGGLVSAFNTFVEMGELDKQYKDIQKPFYLVVKEIGISESIGGGSGRVDLTVSFLKQDNDTLVSVFTAEVFEQAGLGSINSNMVKTKKCLEKAFIKFEEFLSESNKPNFYSDIDSETKQEEEKYNLTIQEYPKDESAEVSLKIPRKFGIYKSLDSFKKNQPEIVGNFTREYTGVDKTILSVYSKTMKRLKGNYFCIFDGENLYMNATSTKYSWNIHFVKVLTVGSLIAWKDRAIKSQMKQANYSAIGAGLGGIAGGAAGATMASSVGLDCVTLDIKTGRFVIMEPKELEILLKEDKELLNAYKTAPNPKDAEVILYYIKEYNKKHAQP